MSMPAEQEHYRSHLVEQYCPYVNRKILGHVTYRYTPEADPAREGQVRLKQELVRADCLLQENCENLGCQRGRHPLAG